MMTRTFHSFFQHLMNILCFTQCFGGSGTVLFDEDEDNEVAVANDQMEKESAVENEEVKQPGGGEGDGDRVVDGDMVWSVDAGLETNVAKDGEAKQQGGEEEENKEFEDNEGVHGDGSADAGVNMEEGGQDVEDEIKGRGTAGEGSDRAFDDDVVWGVDAGLETNAAKDGEAKQQGGEEEENKEFEDNEGVDEDGSADAVVHIKEEEIKGNGRMEEEDDRAIDEDVVWGEEAEEGVEGKEGNNEEEDATVKHAVCLAALEGKEESGGGGKELAEEPDIAPLVYLRPALDGKSEQGCLLLFPEARMMLIFVSASVCVTACVCVLLSAMEKQKWPCTRAATATPYKKWLHRVV